MLIGYHYKLLAWAAPQQQRRPRHDSNDDDNDDTDNDDCGNDEHDKDGHNDDCGGDDEDEDEDDETPTACKHVIDLFTIAPVPRCTIA